MVDTRDDLHPSPSIRVDVTEPGARARRGWLRCQIDRNVRYSTAGLESYCFGNGMPSFTTRCW